MGFFGEETAPMGQVGVRKPGTVSHDKRADLSMMGRKACSRGRHVTIVGDAILWKGQADGKQVQEAWSGQSTVQSPQER